MSEQIPTEEDEIVAKNASIALSDDEYAFLTNADEKEALDWLASKDIAPGNDIDTLILGPDGTSLRKTVKTNIDDFFTTVKTPEATLGEEYSNERTTEMMQLTSKENLDFLKEYALDKGGFDSTKRLLSHEGLSPVAGLDLNRKLSLSFSDVFKTDGRRYAVGYAFKGGVVMPRLFYESNSDGGWRVTPGVEHDQGGRLYSKGKRDRPEYGQYTQTTKLNESVVAMLEQLSRKQNNPKAELSQSEIDEIFDINRIENEERTTFESQVSFTEVRGGGMNAFIPGIGYRYDSEEGRDALENMETPPGFEPDFTNTPVRQYGTEHSLLGKSGIDVFEAELNDRAIEWHVAHDTTGRIWVDRIAYKDVGVTDYGTAQEVILAGALNVKPIEYARQTRWASIGKDYLPFSDRYVDLAPVINRMPWAKRYRQAVGDRLPGNELEIRREVAEEIGETAVELVEDESNNEARKISEQAKLSDLSLDDFLDVMNKAIGTARERVKNDTDIITGVPDHLKDNK